MVIYLKQKIVKGFDRGKVSVLLFFRELPFAARQQRHTVKYSARALHRTPEMV